MSKETTKGAQTPVKFEGSTRGRKDGGNCADGSGEVHDSPRAKGKHVSQDAKISRCLDGATDSTLDDSAVIGTKKREIGPAELVRRQNNLGSRDVRTNLGTGKSATVTVG
jgi:hypothetical protein